jgi:CheY-like chemotaxis protein
MLNPPLNPPLTGQAILCVDDEEIILSSLKEQLKRSFGTAYLYETALSADEAWEIIEELVEDHVGLLIVVSDWLMPGTRGDEFLIQLHQRYPQVVTVMLTGQADPEAILRAQREAQLYACLAKPWTEAALIETIQSGLARL